MSMIKHSAQGNKMILRLLTMISVVTVTGFAVRAMTRHINKKFWQKTIIDQAARALPFALLLSALMWGVGTMQNWSLMRLAGASSSALLLLIVVALLISLPLALLLALFTKKITTTLPRAETADPARRRIITGAAAILPLTATSAMGAGFGASFSRTRIPQIPMALPGLPDALDGYKILHLSDLHLGYYFGLDHLEQTLLDAEPFQPDMVVVTGDIADDLSLMTDAMKLIGQLATPGPKYASIGNHEYFRGIKESIRRIDAGPVPLLLNSYDQFMVGNTPVIIGGANDPVSLRADIHGFLDNSLTRTFNNAPHGPFRLLMSHRPKALDVAGKHKVGLVLSGHTHAGQVGLGGRSAWEIFTENSYLWGAYQKGNTRLYTSAGMGHWFPFRLGAPLEAPLITLRKG